MPASSLTIVGNQAISFGYMPDTTERVQPGCPITAIGDYWGGRELYYVRAAATIRSGGLVTITPVLANGQWRYDATEVANTANLGRPLYAAMAPMTVGQFGYVVRSGLAVVNCTASVAANTTFGIVAAGQGGANSAGKQVLNAVCIAPATTTVVKTNCMANAASNRLRVPSTDGWFIGCYLSGTGIAAATTVLGFDDDERSVILSANTTAAVNGSVTGTYNNGTIFYNLVHMDHAFAQGAIT